MRLDRRAVLGFAAGAFAVSALPAGAADFQVLKGRRIVLVEPYGVGSATQIPIALMQQAIAARTGAPVDIVTVVGGAGAAALEYVCNPPANDAPGSVYFYVGDAATLMVQKANGVVIPFLDKVEPVAKLAGGISVALVVSDKSPFRSIEDFVAEGRKRPMRMATLGRRAPFGLELTMAERQLKLTFADKLVKTRDEILAALASGEVDGSLLITRTVVAAPKVAPPPVRVLLTFGAQRHPGSHSVPTLAETVHNPKESVTGAIWLFTSKNNAGLIDAMVALLGEAAAEPAVKQAADDLAFPLEISPGSYLADESSRFERLMKEYAQ